jgi:hypothetical protein
LPWLDRQAVLKIILSAEILKVRVLTPNLANLLVREPFQILQKAQPSHQPDRPTGTALSRAIKRSQITLETFPFHQARKLHELVPQVNDRTQPRPVKIVLHAILWIVLEHEIATFPACLAVLLQFTKSKAHWDSSLIPIQYTFLGLTI